MSRIEEMENTIEGIPIGNELFSLNKDGVLTLFPEEEVEKGLKANLYDYLEFTNSILPKDWKLYPGESKFIRDPERGVTYRNTGYAEGIDPVKLGYYLCEYPSLELHIQNALYACKVLKNKDIDVSIRESIAAYAKYAFIPVLKTLEQPEVSHKLENLVFLTLDEESYLDARKHWIEDYGCDYDDNIEFNKNIGEVKKQLKKIGLYDAKERLRIEQKRMWLEEHDLTYELPQEKDMGLFEGSIEEARAMLYELSLPEEDYYIESRQKSLSEYYSKLAWQGVVDDGYAFRLVLKDTNNIRNGISLQPDSMKFGEKIIQSIIRGGLLAEGKLHLADSGKIDNFIDKDHPNESGYKAIQAIFRVGDLPGNAQFKMECRLILEDYKRSNEVQHAYYKIQIASPHRIGSSKEYIWDLSELAGLIRDEVEENEICLIDSITKVQGENVLLLSAEDGYATIRLKDGCLDDAWGTVISFTDILYGYGNRKIREYIVVRRVKEEGEWRLLKYKIDFNRARIYRLFSSGSFEQEHDFFLRNLDIIYGHIPLPIEVENVQKGRSDLDPFLSSQELLSLLSKPLDEFQRFLLNEAYLSTRLPMVSKKLRANHKDLRNSMFQSWYNYLNMKAHAAAGLMHSQEVVVKRDKVFTALDRVLRTIDTFDYLYQDNMSDEERRKGYSLLRKYLSNMTGDNFVQEYIQQLIEDRPEYQRILKNVLNYKTYYPNYTHQLLSEDKRIAWVDMAQKFKVNGFAYMFEQMKSQIHQRIIPFWPKIWSDMIYLSDKSKGSVDVREVFNIEDAFKAQPSMWATNSTDNIMVNMVFHHLEYLLELPVNIGLEEEVEHWLHEVERAVRFSDDKDTILSEYFYAEDDMNIQLSREIAKAMIQYNSMEKNGNLKIFKRLVYKEPRLIEWLEVLIQPLQEMSLKYGDTEEISATFRKLVGVLKYLYGEQPHSQLEKSVQEFSDLLLDVCKVWEGTKVGDYFLRDIKQKSGQEDPVKWLRDLRDS